MIFKIDHHIYAATRLRGGFGVFYYSKNLNYLKQETQDDIERKSNYSAPSTFRGEDLEDIENYPVNYAFYDIDDNGKERAAVLRSKYTGATNHTPDRAGNFLSHTMIFEDSLNNICLPPLIMSAPFLDHLTLEDEDNFIPPAETFECDKLINKSFFTEILQYLRNDKRRICTLLKIIDAILDGWLKIRGQNITVWAASGEETTKLIFALYSIIPSYVINKYTFATYTYNPDRVNYKICGVVPGCITEDLPEYIKVFEIEKQSDEYHPKYHFSSTLLRWINDQDVDKIVGLEKTFKEFNVKDFDEQVEIPFKIEQFKNDLQNKNIGDLNNILALFSPTQSMFKSDLIDFIKTNNPKLYLEYMKQQMQQDMMRKSQSMSSCIGLFESYLQSINGMADDRQVFDFYKAFEDNVRRFHSIEIIAANLLTSFKKIKEICLSNCLLKDHLFKLIDNGWERVVNKKDFVHQHKDCILNGDFPNINMWMKKEKIKTDLEKGLFFKNINKYDNQLKKLPLDEKQKIFMKAINVENNKGEMTLSKLESIISQVCRHFQNSCHFWDAFFKLNHDMNNEYKESTYNDIWPVSLIKRNVILLEAIAGRLDKYRTLVETLSEYEIQWLSDLMIMNHLKKSHINFIKMLPPNNKKGHFVLSWINKHR